MTLNIEGLSAKPDAVSEKENPNPNTYLIQFAVQRT